MLHLVFNGVAAGEQCLLEGWQRYDFELAAAALQRGLNRFELRLAARPRCASSAAALAQRSLFAATLTLTPLPAADR